jgi:TorA maturation chaperone TorD
MVGKSKAQANLHKTKTAARKKSQDALAKLVTSCNEQVNKAKYYEEDFRALFAGMEVLNITLLSLFIFGC